MEARSLAGLAAVVAAVLVGSSVFFWVTVQPALAIVATVGAILLLGSAVSLARRGREVVDGTRRNGVALVVAAVVSGLLVIALLAAFIEAGLPILGALVALTVAVLIGAVSGLVSRTRSS